MPATPNNVREKVAEYLRHFRGHYDKDSHQAAGEIIKMVQGDSTADCGAVHPRKGWVCSAHKDNRHRMPDGEGDFLDWTDEVATT